MIAHYTLADFDLTAIATTPQDRQRLAVYLGDFADTRHDRGIDCPGCGLRIVVHDLMFILGGSIRWGLVNGEAECARCGWPIRVYHRLPLDNGETLRWNMLMAYMPTPDAVATCSVRAGDSQSNPGGTIAMSWILTIPPTLVDGDLAAKIRALLPDGLEEVAPGSDLEVQVNATKEALLLQVELGALAGDGEYLAGCLSGHVHVEGSADNYTNVRAERVQAPAEPEPSPDVPPADPVSPVPVGATEGLPDGEQPAPLEAGGSNPSGATGAPGVSPGEPAPEPEPEPEPVEEPPAAEPPVGDAVPETPAEQPAAGEPDPAAGTTPVSTDPAAVEAPAEGEPEPSGESAGAGI